MEGWPRRKTPHAAARAVSAERRQSPLFFFFDVVKVAKDMCSTRRADQGKRWRSFRAAESKWLVYHFMFGRSGKKDAGLLV